MGGLRTGRVGRVRFCIVGRPSFRWRAESRLKHLVLHCDIKCWFWTHLSRCSTGGGKLGLGHYLRVVLLHGGTGLLLHTRRRTGQDEDLSRAQTAGRRRYLEGLELLLLLAQGGGHMRHGCHRANQRRGHHVGLLQLLGVGGDGTRRRLNLDLLSHRMDGLRLALRVVLQLLEHPHLVHLQRRGHSVVTTETARGRRQGAGLTSPALLNKTNEKLKMIHAMWRCQMVVPADCDD